MAHCGSPTFALLLEVVPLPGPLLDGKVTMAVTEEVAGGKASFWQVWGGGM